MSQSPRPQAVQRVQSMAAESRNNMYPIQSAQSSLSSFTSYFGASTADTGDDVLPLENSTGSDPSSLIKKAFAPYVPVVASTDANDLVKRKGFSSFYELLRPFGENFEGKISCKDSTGTTVPLDDFNVNFIEMGPASNLVNYGQIDIQRPGLVPSSNLYLPGGDLVALERQIENEMQLAGENISAATTVQDAEGRAVGSASYYTSFLSSLLSGLPTSPHETFSHPVASCIAISSHNDSPIETLVALYKNSSEHLPSFIDPGFLRYYVLIHDEDEHDLNQSLSLYARMKNSFGAHCYMLRLTSTEVGQADPAVLEVLNFQRRSAPERLRSRWHGGRTNSFLPNATTEAEYVSTQIRYIPYADHAGLSSLVREMITQSIVPYMERCITMWNEQVAGPRRGLAGRFLNVGRSFWGSSRTTAPTSGNGNYDPSTSSYPPSSPQAQLRKLADFAFMLRDWKLANGVYDMLRKDFSTDKAWKHHAGAQEMFVVTQLLIPAPVTTKMRVDTIEPTLDSALYGYLSRCSSPFSALRAMLLTAELLRIRPGGAKDDAAKWIMRIMETNLVGEMTRALLVERTAYCFATSEAAAATQSVSADKFMATYRGSRRRKAAFWHVLAAEHWSTIGKHRLARAALRAALDVYGNSSWIAIQGTLNLLKTESGLVAGYQLTPSPRTEIPQTTDTREAEHESGRVSSVEESESSSKIVGEQDRETATIVSAVNDHAEKSNTEEIEHPLQQLELELT